MTNKLTIDVEVVVVNEFNEGIALCADVDAIPALVVVALDIEGGGEEQLLSSPPVKELNNSDIFSLSTDKFAILFLESFCNDSKSCEI